MQDLIKESASEFRAQVDNYDSIFWTKNGNEEDNDCLSEEAILDWHTKQMEKAYNKGRSDERNEAEEAHKINLIKMVQVTQT